MVKGKRWRGWPATKQPRMKQRDGLGYNGDECTVARSERSSWKNVFVVANSQQQFFGSCRYCIYMHLSNVLLKFGDSCYSTSLWICGGRERWMRNVWLTCLITPACGKNLSSFDHFVPLLFPISQLLSCENIFSGALSAWMVKELCWLLEKRWAS